MQMRLEGGGGGKMGQDDTRIRQRGAGIVSFGLERSGVKKMMQGSEAKFWGWFGNFWSKNTQYGNTNNEECIFLSSF